MPVLDSFVLLTAAELSLAAYNNFPNLSLKL